MSAMDTANTIVTSLFGVGGAGVLVKLWLDKRKPALERQQVLADAAGTNVTSSLAIAAEARAIASDARGIATAAAEEARRYRTGYVRHRRWAVDLVEDWPDVRLSPTPPDLPAEVD